MAELDLGPSAHKEQNKLAGYRVIKIFIYLGAVCALSVATLLVMFFRRANSFELRAFRVPSDAMCPTVCRKERVLVGMDAFAGRPQREAM